MPSTKQCCEGFPNFENQNSVNLEVQTKQFLKCEKMSLFRANFEL